jgi:5-methylcytosine-specific restriction protein A
MPKLRALGPLVRTADTRTTRLGRRFYDLAYSTPAHKTWAAEVVARAGARCEAMDHGHRCIKARPEHRIYADHIIELRDGGQPFDLNNGQCLCASHHEIKTVATRAKRLRSLI